MTWTAIAIIAYALTGAAIGGYHAYQTRHDSFDDGVDLVMASVVLWPLLLAILVGLRIARKADRS